jgi:signal transduction histidine kinase
VDPWGPEESLDVWTSQAVSGFLNAAQETLLDLVWRFWRQGETAEQVADDLCECDAVVMFTPRVEHSALTRALVERGIPVVLSWNRDSDLGVAWVTCDNRGGIAQAVHHVARLGHERIGYVGGAGNISAFDERRQGYLAAMAREGLAVTPGLMAEFVADADPIILHSAAAGLLERRDRPTALVCVTDEAAIAAIETANDMKLRVPEDLAVIGFDDVDEALLIIPHLTTIRQPTTAIAATAFYLAACAALGQEPEIAGWQVEMPVTLVVRESCGAAPTIRSVDGADPSKAGPQTVRQELEWRMRQLAAMNQEMKELLHVASHDLRSPLVTIQGFASTLERKYGDVLDERGKGYLDRIRRSVDNMGGLIDQLLTLSRAHNQPLSLQPLRAREVVRRVVDDLQGEITQAKARVRVARRMPTVLADEVALYQVFLNLIGNALKYTDPSRPALVSITHQSRPEEHEFTVQDNGVGIAPQHREEVFQAFRRLNEVDAEGVGIGLTTVKRIILRHGGRVWVDSQKNQGSAFRFTLPRREKNFDNDDSTDGERRDQRHSGH